MIALLAVGLATLMRWALLPLLGRDLIYLTFFPAVMATAWFGGALPGVLATLLSCFMAPALQPPGATFSVVDPAHLTGLIIFAISNLTFCALCGQLHRVKDGSRQLVQEVQGQLAAERDLSQRLRAIGEREYRFRTIADTAPVMIWMSEISKQLTFFNKQWLDFTGRRLEDELDDGWQQGLHKDDKERRTKLYSDSFDARQSFEVEYRLRRHDGQYRWVLDRAQPTFAPNGSFMGYIGSCIDITDRKDASEMVRRSEEGLRLALEAGRMGTWDWSVATGEVSRSSNLEEILGLQHGDIQRDPTVFMRMIHREDVDTFQSMVQPHTVAQSEFQTEFRIVRPDGAVRWLLAKGKLYRDEDYQPMRAVGVAMDITTRKELEQERVKLLEREQHAREDAEFANQMKDQFLATVSHELRTPLTPILGWTRIMGSGRADQATMERGLTVIERNTRAQARLVDDLLDISRVVSGKLRLTVKPMPISASMEAALETVRPAAEAKEISIKSHIDSSLPLIMGDSDRVQQIIWNLLSNAIKFTPRCGHVRINATQTGSFVRLTVNDTGEGIDAAFLPRVFERFTQADSSVSRVAGGLGIGLAVVRQLTELHGGAVKAESPGRGKGATFTVTLPVAAVQSGWEVSPIPQARRDVPNLRETKVLVIDDQPDSREFLQIALQQTGADVATAGTVAEAMDIFSRHTPDIVVSDISMPDEDGYVLIDRIRALPPDRGGRVPAIALTAFAGADDRLRAIGAGYNEHLPKPVEPIDLARVLARLTTDAKNALA